VDAAALMVVSVRWPVFRGADERAAAAPRPRAAFGGHSIAVQNFNENLTSC